ncbi:hypothetical protein TWF730_008668 [Orbilia blumenaviensis]|uniref:Uncharacterized protein n=1 Tax=Orbilia blumenaviensis TaxID=1796055 RepID=A0AAV9V9K9_9PEZI
MSPHRRYRPGITPESGEPREITIEQEVVPALAMLNPQYPVQPPRGHSQRGSTSGDCSREGQTPNHRSFNESQNLRDGRFMANASGIPERGYYPVAQAPGATNAIQSATFSVSCTTGASNYARNAQRFEDTYQGPTHGLGGASGVISITPRAERGPVATGWGHTLQSPPQLLGRSGELAVGGDTGLTQRPNVGKRISANNDPTRPYLHVPHVQAQQPSPLQHHHHDHRNNTTKRNHLSTTASPLPTSLNPSLPICNSSSSSDTKASFSQAQLKMGTLRSLKSAVTGSEAPTQTESSAPVEQPTSAPAREDSDDSCDALLKNTPIFPDGTQETSSPSTPQASRQITLTSESKSTDTPSETCTTTERKTEETVRRSTDETKGAELASKFSELALVPAANERKSDVTESSKPLDLPSHNLATEDLKKSKPEGQQKSEASYQQQETNKPSTNQSREAQITSIIEPGSPNKKEKKKESEQKGHTKNTNSFSKRGKKGRHNKSNSFNSNKKMNSGSSSISAQGKQPEPETLKGNADPKPQGILESRPTHNRLNSEASTTSASRRRRNLSVASMTISSNQTRNLQENMAPDLKTASPATGASIDTPNSTMHPPRIQQLQDDSPSHGQPRSVERQIASTSTTHTQRENHEAPSGYPYQTAGTGFNTEPRQFYPSHPTQPMQTGYQMQPPTGLNHQIGQNQVPFSQQPQYHMRPQVPQTYQGNHQNQQSRQWYNQNQRSHSNHRRNQQYHHMYHQGQPQGYYQNFTNSFGQGSGVSARYSGAQHYPQQRIQQGPGGNFSFQQPQNQQKPVPPPFQRAASQTAPPTPHRSNRYAANPAGQNAYGGPSFNRFAAGQGGSKNPTNMAPEAGSGHVRNRSSLSQNEYGRNSERPPITQAARYKPRPPSPPLIVKLAVRDRKLLWPIGPFIPFDRMTVSPWELDSTTFVNVLCTTVGVLRLPFSVEFLRMLKSVLPPKHGDHIITYPSILADPADMTPYWERCYYCQQFLFKYAKHLGSKSFDDIPMKDWPRVEIMFGTDNTEKSKFNIYLSQPDDKRLLFRCVEQKLSDSDKAPKATYFVTVHQTGVHQVQYSDPFLQDEKVPLPPLDGSQDPRTTPGFQYNLPQYLCLNESRGLISCGFTEIGVPAKRLNFHPFGPRNFDSLWYAMAHLQELVTADDNASVNAMLKWDSRGVLGIDDVIKYCKHRTAVMMGNGEPKFVEHEEVLKRNCKAGPPPPPPEKEPEFPRSESDCDESSQSKSPDVTEDEKIS